jgi:hypothetical protein
MEIKNYTVIQDGGILKCINTSNGSILGSINITNKIITNPIVTGERCTVVYEGGRGFVYKLPNFNIATTFNT